MNILFLSFYFEPDLCAGSFRNTSFLKELLPLLSATDKVTVITTKPNRYSTYSEECKDYENFGNVEIYRVDIPKHNSGFLDQIQSFYTYYKNAKRISKDKEVDIVYASSSRLFTAFLGRKISKSKGAKLYLDIRDIFVDTISDIFKSKRYITFFLIPILKIFEKYTFANANHINLVSEGFKGYFERYTKPQYSYFTNGIDDIFLEARDQINTDNEAFEPKTITYAGNLGEGQGLEKIVPDLAERLPVGYKIQIIGDGGRKAILQKKMEELNLKNVELINPVKRDELIKIYAKSSFLFLHLNDYEAFEKVLPSKVFEYAVFDLPILAGVSGYAASFIKKNIPNSFVFEPGDAEQALQCILSYKDKEIDRSEFIENYSRSTIMKRMAKSLIEL